MSKRRWYASACLTLCGLVGIAQADVTPQDEGMRRLKVYQTIAPHGETPFEEQLNPYTGDPTVQQADVVLRQSDVIDPAHGDRDRYTAIWTARIASSKLALRWWVG